MALSPKAQARIWQLLFASVAIAGLGLFAVPGGAPFGIAMIVLGALSWLAVTVIINYHSN